MADPLSSPFPGFDPWLEDPAYWEDFHRQFIVDLRVAILDGLPQGYDARIDQRLRVYEQRFDNSIDIQRRQPDIGIEWHGGTSTAATAVLDAVTLDPVLVPQTETVEERDVWIEIVQLPERRLVTAIEVLSPANKTADGAATYQSRRAEYRAQHANVVEIDFLQGGKRTASAAAAKDKDCTCTVTRHVPRHVVAEVYGWKLADPLPVVPVPLHAPDPDMPINLARVFATTYAAGRYRRRLRYADYQPPLAPELVGWSKSCLTSV